MISLTEFAEAIGAEMGERSERPIGRFVIDSRDARRDDIFFGLSGGTTHGGRFAADAERRGAAAVVPPDFAAPGRLVVDDVAAALRSAAALRRRRFAGTVVAVTGSVGKTTTRRLVAAVLAKIGATVQSPRNYNNRLGVPVTLGLLTGETRFAVVEIASSMPGEVLDLAALVKPDAAVITPVAAAHLDGLRSLEGVMREKWSLADTVAEGGPVFSTDDPPPWVTRTCEVVAPQEIRTDGRRTRFRIANADLSVGLPGVHQASGAALAFAVGRHFGVSVDDIRDALASVGSEPGRCHVVDADGVHVIDDSYNSSPSALVAGLRLLCDTPAGRRFVVLGDMLGLGESAEVLHRDVAAAMPDKVETVFAFGDLAGVVADGCRDRGRRFESIDALIADLKRTLRPGDAVLVKGSRATRMERVVEAIQKQRARNCSE